MGKRVPESDSSSEESDLDDSDRELQDAFEKGLLKPGLNVVSERSNKKYSNNVDDMAMKIKQMELNLPWIETLDLINDPAVVAPEVAKQLEDTTQRQLNIRANNAKLPKIGINEDPVLNEFKRENLFHRQAQASAIEGLQRLHSLGIVTRRPETYFAEMAKSDHHMQKVRQNLMAKQAGQARAEKVRQIRQQKKMGKQIQVQTKQQRASEKKAVMGEIKKYRKGARNQDDGPDPPRKNKSALKRNMKDKKFGFGGKKRGGKANTRDSTSDFSELHKKSNKKGAFKKMGAPAGKGKRPGKSRRVNFKAKGRK